MTNLDNLTKEEREAVAKILEEMSSNGVSEKMTELINSDYDEIPVDIATFLHEKQYLGNGLTDADGRFTLFPY
jgi:K+/H+ antiporter YhaU regulatory subunit KhtT